MKKKQVCQKCKGTGIAEKKNDWNYCSKCHGLGSTTRTDDFTECILFYPTSAVRIGYEPIRRLGDYL